MMVRCGFPKLAAAAILAFALAALPDTALAQVNVEAMQGVQFDFLAPGARSLAMGGAFVAVADDATAALSNPAGLSKLTRSEVSIELRTRQFKVPYAFSGRFLGTPTGIGVDTASTTTFQEASTSEGNLAFLSVVFASPERRWSAAAYRHATVSFSTNLTTAGPFTIQDDDDFRFFPATGELQLNIVNYGFAGSYKLWRSCSDVSGARVCEDKLALGGGLSIYQFDVDSLSTRFAFPVFVPQTATGAFFGPPQYTTEQNHQTLDGEETGVGVNFGMIVTPTRRLQLGLSHRRGTSFDFTARNEGPGFTGYTRAGTFAMPHVTTAGASFRLGASSVVAVDYSHVTYSRLTDRFVDIFFNPATDPPDEDRAEDFSVDNGDELHVGFEHQMVNMRWTPALRLGTWFDPAHAATAPIERNALFRPGDDAWHFTIGGGLVISRAELSIGGDFSDRGNIGSASLVWRF